MHDNERYWWQTAWGDWLGPGDFFEPSTDAAVPDDTVLGAWHPVVSSGDVILWKRVMHIVDGQQLQEEIHDWLEEEGDSEDDDEDEDDDEEEDDDEDGD